MANIIQYAKFYAGLSELETQLNEIANLGMHLKIDTELTETLIKSADAIQKHIKDYADVKLVKTGEE